MTKIEWTNATWNPTLGCSRVSPGCDNCYAVRVAARQMQEAHKGLTAGGDWTGEVRCMPERLEQPLRWRDSRMVFVDSMSDLFHPAVPQEFIERVFSVMDEAQRHTFQILTKRPQRMAGLLRSDNNTWPVWPLPNVWLGVSVEDQRYADLRISHLLATPAAVRFLSIEPLLSPVDITPWIETGHDRGGIDWVIVGGESGPGARPMRPDWVRALRDQCDTAGVPFFFKQAGAVLGREWGCSDRSGGKIDEFPREFRVREFPRAA